MRNRKWVAMPPVLASALMTLSVAASGPATAQSASNGSDASANNPGSYYKSYGNDSYYVGNYYTNLGYKPDDTGAAGAGGGDGGGKSGGASPSSGGASSGGANAGGGGKPSGGATASTGGGGAAASSGGQKSQGASGSN